MKLWTYGEAKTKLISDIDLQDQTFILSNELIGYFNEGIEEAEAEILKLDEDYFLTSFYLPLVLGQAAYDYPYNIYAFKFRGIEYSNGTTIYPILRFRRKGKFDQMATAQQYSQSDDYRWFHTNDSAGAAKLNLIPAARETAIVPPLANPFTPVTGWYIRHANRVPLLGEYIPRYDVLVSTTSINIATDQISVQNAYVTGDTVKVDTTGTLPAGLVKNTVYFVINSGGGLIKLATTLQNALAGTAIDLTSVGSGILYISIAANQTIVDNTLIDIPEFTKFVLQWAKCRCFEKEGDQRLSGATDTLTQQRGQMVSTLTEAQQDDENSIEPDMSTYNEMS